MKLLVLFLVLISQIVAAYDPGLQLANDYHGNIKLENYWVSEK